MAASLRAGAAACQPDAAEPGRGQARRGTLAVAACRAAPVAGTMR